MLHRRLCIRRLRVTCVHPCGGSTSDAGDEEMGPACSHLLGQNVDLRTICDRMAEWVLRSGGDQARQLSCDSPSGDCPGAEMRGASARPVATLGTTQ